MNFNVGPNERIHRIAFGAVAGMLTLCGGAAISRLVLGALAASSIWTGITRRCPVNEALGFTDSLGIEAMRCGRDPGLRGQEEEERSRPSSREGTRQEGRPVEVAAAPEAAIAAPPQD